MSPPKRSDVEKQVTAIRLGCHNLRGHLGVQLQEVTSQSRTLLELSLCLMNCSTVCFTSVGLEICLPTVSLQSLTQFPTGPKQPIPISIPKHLPELNVNSAEKREVKKKISIFFKISQFYSKNQTFSSSQHCQSFAFHIVIIFDY